MILHSCRAADWSFRDRDFLRRRGYPMIREAARFYAEYLTLGTDGCYHMIPTVSAETCRRREVGAIKLVHRSHLPIPM